MNFRRRFRGIATAGLRPASTTPRNRRATPLTGRGTNYRTRNDVSTKSATSLYAAEQARADIAEARDLWRQTQPKLNSGKLIFRDETWTTTNMVRRYGRAPRGQRLVEAVPHGHWQISTFIGGLRESGMVAPCGIDGAVDDDMFVAYIEPVLVPELTPGDTVIMDNLSSHKVAGVRVAIEAANATLLYRPAHIPDLNRIEMAFAKLTSLLRAKAPRTMAELRHAPGLIAQTFSQTECQNYLRHAGYFQSA